MWRPQGVSLHGTHLDNVLVDLLGVSVDQVDLLGVAVLHHLLFVGVVLVLVRHDGVLRVQVQCWGPGGSWGPGSGVRGVLEVCGDAESGVSRCGLQAVGRTLVNPCVTAVTMGVSNASGQLLLLL